MHDAYDSWLALAVGEIEGFAPFSMYLPIEKGGCATMPDKSAGADEWFVEAPLSDPGEDLEGECMSMQGLQKGLETFWTLGANVDADHKWERTGDWKYLIGKGISIFKAAHPRTGSMVPWLRSKLYKSKELARSAWEHLNDPDSNGMGYSVAGGAIRKAGSKILEPIITSVALTSRPVVAMNAGTARIAKSLEEAMQHPEIPLSDLRLPVVPELMGVLTPFPVLKALGIAPGLTAKYTGHGLEALGTEDLMGCRKRRKRKRRDCDDDESVHKALDPEIACVLAGQLTLLRHRAGDRRIA